MIEINLLPPQYRAVERTPLPVFVGLIAAILLVGLAVGLFARVFREASQLRETVEELDRQLAVERERAKEFDDLMRRIAEADKRVKTVFAIAESKMPWSIKLEQFVELMPKNIWIDRMDLERRPDGTGEMRMQVNARGTALKSTTEFEQLLRSSTNFFYHFDAVISREVVKKNAPAGYLEPQYLSFQMVMPLRRTEIGKVAGR